MQRQREGGDRDAFVESQGSFGAPGTVLAAYHAPRFVGTYTVHPDLRVAA